MLNAVRRFLADIGGPDTGRDSGMPDERLAAVALLVHMGGIDGEFSDDESATLRSLVKARFGIDESDAEKLIAKAREADLEAVDLYGFTSVLKSQLDEAGRTRVVEMMWEIVFADGEVHEFEDNLVWRVAELLGVSSRDRMLMKQEARRKRGLD
jgi:uncharacterized tellurite resistance protein B-like protein